MTNIYTNTSHTVWGRTSTNRKATIREIANEIGKGLYMVRHLENGSRLSRVEPENRKGV